MLLNDIRNEFLQHQAFQQITVEQNPVHGVFLSEFLNQINNSVKISFPESTWVRAEISRITYKRTARNQPYYIIELIEISNGKQIASAQAKIWQQYLNKIDQFEKITGIKLDTGIKILISVNVSIHPLYGLDIQIIDIDPNYTLGDVIAKKNFIREKLKSEGIFNKNKLLITPKDFTKVVVISPGNAAGLGDFKASAKILEEFKLCQFIYFEATFQSKDAPSTIIQALKKSLGNGNSNIDAMVLIRGGGASTDLHWLNDENLAKEICISTVPIFTGIGHEKDSTIIDEVANSSFDTPSKVIEYIKSSIFKEADIAEINWIQINRQIEKSASNQYIKIIGIQREIHKKITTKIDNLGKFASEYYQSILDEQNNYINSQKSKLDSLIRSARDGAENKIKIANNNIKHLISSSFSHIENGIKISTQKIIGFHDQINRTTKNRITYFFDKVESYISEINATIKKITSQNQKNIINKYSDISYHINTQIKYSEDKIIGLNEIIKSYSPNKILRRGYAFIKREGAYIKSAKSISKGTELEIIFHDGAVKTIASTNSEKKHV